MTTGDKESKEIVVFVVALVNVLVHVAGVSPLALLGSLGELLGTVQLAGPAFTNWQGAAAEAADGYSDVEKADLNKAIEALELPVDSVEKVAEAVLKAGVSLADLVALVRGAKAPVA